MERSLSVAWLGSVDYRAALVLQDALVDRRRSGAISDTLLTLEHPHVFTLGRGADQGFIHFLPPDVQVYRVSRGGQVTYHGPGQLIGYPIIQLEGAARDVGKYLKSLEEVLIRTLARAGIEAQRRDGFTGVWVNGRKIASIGVGIRRWITFHGFALNVTADLGYFNAITPCGIEGCEMTSIAALGYSDVTVGDVASMVEADFCDVFRYDRLEPVESARLWRFVDARPHNCEA